MWIVEVRFIPQGGDFSAALSNGEMIGKGRSFAPATLAHLAHDEEDGVFESVVSISITSIADNKHCVRFLLEFSSVRVFFCNSHVLGNERMFLNVYQKRVKFL